MKALTIKDNVIYVNEQFAKGIKNATDLNNFYAFVEEDFEDITYDFGNETERIETFMNDLNYCGGHYDCEVIKRLFANFN